MANIQIADRFDNFTWKLERTEKQQAPQDQAAPAEARKKRMSYFESLELLFGVYVNTMLNDRE
jgi:hypothetical protein